MKSQVKKWLIASLLIAGILSLFASSHPDGFEKAGEETGYIETATALLASPFPDYTIPFMDSWVSNSLAGIIGVIITYFLFTTLGKLVGRNTR
ncbi:MULTISPECIES: PDGLE domain-containing protein [Aneurinibacillus]|jgi:hypothetical protein|uniref:PDGLE domain-containing protein n=1 Tax=Aneurinibacillus danicus TaxID=267746 RepID=A0A511V906_9BACL|nr:MULTISPECIES: PDGLE domain-containing protein [Aneurinibacillus]GEN34368.1 hypothetical protein ADA01nite_18280 [Aneurinibacillus danicus]